MELVFYKAMLDSLWDGVYFIDKEKKIIYCNKSAEKLTGYARDDIIGTYCYIERLNHQTCEGGLACRSECCPLARTLMDGLLREEELFFHHKSGRRIPLLVRLSPVRNENNEIIGVLELISDNSQKEHLLEQIAQYRELSLFDALTALGNKRYVEIELSARINEMKKQAKPDFGVVFADIDHFKRINDRYGHATGDKIIKMVGSAIKSVIAGKGMAFRWGGEEFFAIVSTDDHEELYRVAAKVNEVIGQSVFRMGFEEIKVTISVGATLAKLADSGEVLLKRADDLLYISKNTGRNKVTVA